MDEVYDVLHGCADSIDQRPIRDRRVTYTGLMRVLIYEQWHGGHHDNYMSCLVPQVARLCDRLVVGMGATMKASSTARNVWAALPNVEFAPTLPEVGPALRAGDRLAAARNLIATLRTVKPDFTLLPSADAQATGLAALNMVGFNALRRFGPVEGTLHFSYGHCALQGKERFKELVYRQTYRRVPYAVLNFVNFAYYEYVRDQQLIAPERMRFVGDPVPQPRRIGRSAARRLLGLRPDGRYLGLLGSLDHRKAIPQLLAAFRAAALAPDDRLVLAGALHAPYAALIGAQYGDLVKAGRLVVIDRYLTDAELAHGFEALDLATIAYGRFASLASLALKSIAAGTPIIAHDFGWLQAAVKRFGVGVTTDIFNPAVFARDMAAALERGPMRMDSEPLRRLLAFHTPENFVGQMTRGLRRTLGLPELALVDWNPVGRAAQSTEPGHFDRPMSVGL